MIKAIAIDDEPPALSILKKFCNTAGTVELTRAFTGTKAAKDWLVSGPVDLLFLDINMPAISGLDFYKGLDKKMMVIFTTAYAEFAVEGFNLNAVDYLLKPFSYERFLQAVEKALEFHHHKQSKDPNTVFVKSDLSVVKVQISDILFIEAYSDYLKIHRQSGKTIITRMTMRAIIEMLPEDLIRIHRSYIIPIKKIDRLESRKVVIGHQEIPIGRTYYKHVQNQLDSNKPH